MDDGKGSVETYQREAQQDEQPQVRVTWQMSEDSGRNKSCPFDHGCLVPPKTRVDSDLTLPR